MCAKKIINERKITSSLERALIGVFESGKYVYLSNCAYAMYVDMNQIKEGGRLWKLIESAVEFGGGYDKIAVGSFGEWESLIVGKELEKYFKILEPEIIYKLDMEAKYTGEIREFKPIWERERKLDIVKNGDDTERGFDVRFVDTIKDKLVVKEGTFGMGEYSPVRYQAFGRNHEHILSFVLMPVRMNV